MEQIPEPTVTDTRLSGELLDGRYELSEEIGRGGMAVIYRAVDRMMGREVAVKIMNCDQHGTEVYRERFNREIKALSLLEHENLVRIFSAGVDSKKGPYLTMELLQGLTLEQIFQELKSINSEEFQKIFLPVLSGLEYAHSKNIVHRDLKPGNIFVCSASIETDSKENRKAQATRLLEKLENPSEVKIVDFGIAKIFQATADQAATLTVAQPFSRYC